MNKLLHYIDSIQSGVWGEEEKNDINDVKCLRVADFKYENLSYQEPETIRNISDKNKYLLKKGDILIEKSGGGEKTTVGRAVFVDRDSDSVYANFIDRLRPKNSNHGKFLTYFLACLYARQINTKYIKQNTGIQNLDLHGYLREEVKFPPESIWEKIVQFLDQKVARIDEAIAKKKKLMELLEEKRRRQITKVMTKGLNEKNFVDSDIEWLGKIPTNYELTYLIDVAYERKEKNYKGLEPQLLSLSYGKIINKDVNTLGGLLPDSFDTYQLVKKGNIVLRLTDLQNDHVSLRVGFVEEPGMITSAYSSLTAKPKILAKYLYYYLHSADLLKVFYSMGGGVRQSMKFEDLKRLPIVLPDRNIQEKTINFLDSYNKLVDEAKNKLHKSIEFLEEYKTSLISNAVTGKVKI